MSSVVVVFTTAWVMASSRLTVMPLTAGSSASCWPSRSVSIQTKSPIETTSTFRSAWASLSVGVFDVSVPVSGLFPSGFVSAISPGPGETKATLWIGPFCPALIFAVTVIGLPSAFGANPSFAVHVNVASTQV